MAKTLQKWLDEFVNNGADANDVTNWPENTGGGVVRVEELPETGEEHIIYELEPHKAYNGMTSPIVFKK